MVADPSRAAWLGARNPRGCHMPTTWLVSPTRASRVKHGPTAGARTAPGVNAGDHRNAHSLGAGQEERLPNGATWLGGQGDQES